MRVRSLARRVFLEKSASKIWPARCSHGGFMNMPVHFHKPTRAAWARRTRSLLERRAEAELDLTPTPTPVAVDLPLEALLVDAALEPPEPAREPAATEPPRGRKRLAVAAFALALVGGGALIASATSRTLASIDTSGPKVVAAIAPQAHVAAALRPTQDEPPPASPPQESDAPRPPRADAHVRREGYAHIPGGVLYVPDTFASEDGAYDLYLHFHGSIRVVRESAEHAGLNAAVAVVNLGKNSAPYLDGYAVPGSYEELLASIDRAVLSRGLAQPQRQRVAIGSWSGGYGALSRILEHGRGLESLDAVLVLDGIHCGFAEDNPKALNVRIVSPFLGATRRAAEGEILFSITHSEIDPIAYAGTYLTAGYLLDVVHGTRGEPQEGPPPHLKLRAAEGAVSKALEKRMKPISEARVGKFHVRGYRGNTPEHHMAHLLQMGATVMPELAARWKAAPRRKR
jgi:hypothetical protein